MPYLVKVLAWNAAQNTVLNVAVVSILANLVTAVVVIDESIRRRQQRKRRESAGLQ
jgi:uncharacterized membrane-anchored protein